MDRRGALESRANEPDLRGTVTFLGARNDIATILPAFDIFALASRSEGVSLTLLEAASVGLPIVATRVGGNAEVVVEGETGLLVPPGDPVAFCSALEAIATQGKSAAMGRAGRARVEAQFSLEGMARAYQDLYRDALRKAGHGRSRVAKNPND